MVKGYLANELINIRGKMKDLLKDERGETNIIAIILIILVVIILAALFKQQLTSIVNGLFNQIRDSLGL